jgi:DNA-binding CsgD family transcriptional regulator
VATDRFTAYVGALSLLAAAAERAPVLAVIDDVHWLDATSREAVAFVARRLGQEGVVMLLAERSGEGPGFGDAGVPELALSGLDRAASLTLLAARAAPLAPEVATGLVDATGGNPLALLEGAAELSPAQRAGTELIDVPVPVGATVERAFGRALGVLPDGTRRALLIAAVSESGAMLEVAQALAASGIGASALESAESAGLVTIADGTVRFRHPLLRSVAYRAMPAPDRRAAHRAIAEAVSGARSVERRAWHRAAAALAPDEAVAVALAEVAAAARDRAGPAAAGPASERAARLTPDREQRARRLLQAAEDRLTLGGADRALVLLGEALALAPDPLLRADIQLLRGLAKERAGNPAAAASLLVAEAARVAPRDTRRAATMTMAAVQPHFEIGQTATALHTAHRGWELAARAGLGPTPAGLPLGMVLLLCGERPRARPLLVQAATWLENSASPLQLGPVLYFGLGQAFTWLGEYDRARSILTSGIQQARDWSAPALLPYGLLSVSDLHFRVGRWAAAYAAGTEAVELAEQTGQPNDQGYTLCVLARVEAGLGRERHCRAHLARANHLIDQCGTEILRDHVAAALGFLELGHGRDAAIPALEDLARITEERPAADPEILQWESDLVEAYVRAGRRADAHEALARFSDAARRSGGSWALAATARCHGMLADDNGFAQHFGEALAGHDTPFETARTRLCFGERLRRAGRRIEARENLQEALRAFDRLGALPWAERARGELGVAGAQPDRRRTAAENLTSQELRVALAVAQGSTNRDAASALFLSTKTVEFHLRNIYRKLGIGSRTELVRTLLTAARTEPDATS